MRPQDVVYNISVAERVWYDVDVVSTSQPQPQSHMKHTETFRVLEVTDCRGELTHHRTDTFTARFWRLEQAAWYAVMMDTVDGDGYDLKDEFRDVSVIDYDAGVAVCQIHEEGSRIVCSEKCTLSDEQVIELIMSEPWQSRWTAFGTTIIGKDEYEQE